MGANIPERKIFLAQSCSEEATSKDKAIAVIAHVNQSLDQLIKPSDEQRRMVSEAVAHLDGYELQIWARNQ